ncbi:MAG: hypothetical protein R3C71_04285 [Candidatus Krumholzibacteriia bacterium]
MKKMLVVFALLALAVGSAQAQSQTSWIGIYSDDLMSSCDAVMNTAYVTVTVYFYAHMDPAEIDACTSVEFKVANWPGAGGLITQNWDTELVIGGPATDVSLAFQVPLAGPDAFLGTVDFFPLSDTWLGNDYQMEIVPGDVGGGGNIIIVDTNFDEIPVSGCTFTVNCTTGNCSCGCGTATEVSSWGSVKSLY